MRTESYLENVMPSDYCVHITDGKASRKCRCEAYICQSIPAIGEDFDLNSKSSSNTVKWIDDKTLFEKGMIVWEYVPGDIELRMDGFNAGMDYKTHVKVTTRNPIRDTSFWMEMIPGRVADLKSGADITNKGYGRFAVNAGQMVIGDEVCFEVRDTCNNLLTECRKVSDEFQYGKENVSELSYTDLIDEPTLMNILSKLSVLGQRADIDFEIDGWRLINSKHLILDNYKFVEAYNLKDGRYFLLSFNDKK